MIKPDTDTTRNATLLICPLAADSIPAMRAQMDKAKLLGATAVECRLDFLALAPNQSLGEEDLSALLTGAPLPVIVTNRPVREGGRFDGPEERRLEILRQAARLGASFVDVEADVPSADRPDGDIILSHHDFDRVPLDLDAQAASLEASEAAVNKIAFAARGPEDALRALDIIRACDKPTITLAMGQAGVISRILARKVGAMGTFAALCAGTESAPGQPTLEEMIDLYRWNSLTAETAVCGVIGCPVAHSMSPAIHNAAFEAAGLNAVYVPLLIEPGADKFNRFMEALLQRPWLNWRGLSVTIPHKENALAFVGASNCDELSVRIGAINTITIGPDGSLRGDNTDYAAAIDALCGAMDISRDGLAGRKTALLGAGGAARALVAALAHYGAKITIYNRTVSRAEALAEEFGCDAVGLDALGSMDAEIIVNCTPVGMHPNVDASPLAEFSLPPCVKVVFDTIYNPVETRLLADAREVGCRTVSGLDMFVRQAVAQFERWTGAGAPVDVMREVVMSRLQK